MIPLIKILQSAVESFHAFLRFDIHPLGSSAILQDSLGYFRDPVGFEMILSIIVQDVPELIKISQIFCTILYARIGSCLLSSPIVKLLKKKLVYFLTKMLQHLVYNFLGFHRIFLTTATILLRITAGIFARFLVRITTRILAKLLAQITTRILVRFTTTILARIFVRIIKASWQELW